MQVSSACLHEVYTSDIARRGEAGPQYSSSFPPFSRFFQVSRLLPAYNLNRWSFWGTYLTTSDPKHKEHTYFSYLLCLRKLFKKNFHFCLFLKFWTEVEEYLLNNTVFIFESSPQDWWSMSLLPCLCSYPGPCYHHISLISDLFMWGQQWWGWAWEEAALCCFWDHRDQGSREDGVGLTQLREATQRNSTGLPLHRVCSQLPKFPKLGCWDTSINAFYSFGGERKVSFCT